MSASSTPTRWPMACRPSARLTAVVDLPTPPLPEATAIMCLMPATWITFRPAPGAGGGAAGAPLFHTGALRHRSAPRRRAGRRRSARLLRRQHGNDALHALHLAHDLL